MTEVNPSKHTGPNAENIDVAAVWLALLRGPRRSHQFERALKQWREADPAHEDAWETVTAAWEMTHSIPYPTVTARRVSARVYPQAGLWRTATGIVMTIAVVAVLAVVLHGRASGISTSVGEQRTLILEDGSHVTLNTDTHVRVQYDSKRRAVYLQSGEALFDVARQGPEKPFVVIAAGREISALGTSFVVRRDTQRLSVTLMEGQISVAPSGANQHPNEAGSRTLNPGERLTYADDGTPKLDYPSLSLVTAWRQGHVQLDNTALADAISELNRYSETQIVLNDQKVGSLPVTGVFRAGDSLSFARAMAQIYGFHWTERSRQIVITGTPTNPWTALPK